MAWTLRYWGAPAPQADITLTQSVNIPSTDTGKTEREKQNERSPNLNSLDGRH